MASAAQLKAKQPRMTIVELREQESYRQLTDKQRLFVENLLASNFDRVFSVMSAYQCKTRETARVLSYEFLESPKIRAVLRAFYGEAEPDAREEFFAWLEKRIRRGTLTVAQRDSIKLLCAARGWDVPGETSAPKKREVPVGCQPIYRGETVVGYFALNDERVDF